MSQKVKALRRMIPVMIVLASACGDGKAGEDADADPAADDAAADDAASDPAPDGDVPPDPAGDPDADATDPWTDDLEEEEITVLGTAYYVDSVDGSDSNPGTSEDLPWQTLGPVHERDFEPGDVIFFKRGSVWTEGLVIDDSGTEAMPIIFTAYGEGERPVFSTPGYGHDWSKAVAIYASWVIVEKLLARDTHEAGVYIGEESTYTIVRDVEATDVGIGIIVAGQHNLVTGNYLHDLHMVNNTEGGDDDYGALGVGIFGSHNEISYNRMVNCIAPSYDYGVDGGVVEWYGEVQDSYVHHNWGVSCDGFLEVGGGSAVDITIAYNVSVNNGGLGWLHAEGTFASRIENFRVENNTFVETEDYEEPRWAMFGFTGTPPAGEFQIRNNIFYAEDFRLIAAADDRGWDIVHENNLYYLLAEGSSVGFTPAPGEVVDDPQFVDLAAQDHHLAEGSPAVDAGLDLGYTIDFEGLAVPAGGAPDIGAYERH